MSLENCPQPQEKGKGIDPKSPEIVALANKIRKQLRGEEDKNDS